jgi:16S rRNA (adenine1518-N6/adenine1519-N6)-dimethyltransferase
MVDSVKDLAEKYGVIPKKSLGQNFLFDLNLTRRIARCAGDLSSSTVLEIGPGPGGLTRALLDEGAAKVIAIEQDQRCISLLNELAQHYPGRLEVVYADALKIDENQFVVAGEPLKIVANLPYNIGTVLLFKWLAKARLFESITLMLQKEVVDRITAEHNTKQYGRVAIMAQAVCATFKHFDVSPKAFFPPPKVMSSIVQLIPRVEPVCSVDTEHLEEATKIIFSQRRKMLRQTIKLINPHYQPILNELGIADSLRPEQLSLEQWCMLVNKLYTRLV